MENKNEKSVKTRQPATVKSAMRTMQIINFVVTSPIKKNLTNLHRELDIPYSSLSYLLQAMVQEQYLYYDQDTKLYSPGIQLVKIGIICMNNSNLTDEMYKGAKILSERVQETTHCGVLEGRFVVFTAKHHGNSRTSMIDHLGMSIPAHVTAIGKVLLADLDDEQIDRLYDHVALERYTKYSHTDLDQVKEELEMVRQQGYAVDNQEAVRDGYCIAAPIRGASGKVVAGISINLLTEKVTPEYKRFLIQSVQEAARNISVRLGYVAPQADV